MTTHLVEFKYNLPETASIEVDLNPLMADTMKMEDALDEIKEIYDDVTDIEIFNIKEV